jgi:acyl phosphate:glycerol-3-phosphate acyltransferase
MIWLMVLYLIVSYLLGAIPTGYIIARKLKGIDIREHGSGNVGATNVKRVVGNKAGTVTLVLDFLKGLLPVLGATFLFPAATDPYHLMPVLSGIFAVIGHSKSIYIGFSGGKSVITSLGMMVGLQPTAAMVVAAIAVSAIKISRYVSVGSILGAALTPIAFWLFGAPPSQICFTLFMALYVIFLHRSNIQRLLKHQENRI